jgi:hypothetical protein
MLRIKVEQQRVAYAQGGRNGGAVSGKSQYRIGAVAMLVYQMVGRVRRAGAAVGRQLQMRQRVGGDRPMMCAQLAPGDDTVVIAVDSDGVIEIAQRDVPLSRNVPSVEVQAEVAVARFMRGGRRHR